MAFAALTGKLNLEVGDFEDGVDDAEDSIDSLGDRAEEVGGRMQRVGGAMTAGLTLPLTGMAAQSARTAAGFEQAMTESMAVMDDVSKEMEEKLEQTARDVATTTTLSAEDAADAYFYLASAGLEAAEAMEIMPDVANFAEAGQLSLAEASDIATDVTAAFGKEIEETEEVMDVLVGTNQRHNQSVEEMADAMSRVAPTAGGLGMEIEELSAAVGALGDVGFDGQRAGTALNTVLSQMADESGPAAQAMEDMGVSVRDAEGDIRPLVGIIEDFEAAGADAGDMAELFGTRGGPVMSALLEQGSDGLEEYTGELDNVEGASEETAEEMRENFNAQLQMARDQLADAGITIGDDLLPYLGMLVNTVSAGAEWFGNLSGRTQTAIVLFGGLVAAGGPLIMLLGMLATNAVATAGAFTTLGGLAAGAAGTLSGALLPSSIAAQGGLTGLAAAALAANVALGPITVPIWAIVAAVGALLAAVVGFAAAYRSNWMSVRDYTEWAIDPILRAIDFLIERIFGISDASGQVGQAFSDFLDWIISQANRVPGIDIDGDGLGFDIDTEMDSDVASDLDDGLEDGLDEAALAEGIEDDVSDGAEDGIASGLIDGLEKSDVADFLEDEIERVDAEMDDASSGEFTELFHEREELEEMLEEVEDAHSLADIDDELAAQAVEAELEAQMADEEQRMAIAELVGEDFESEIDIDDELESLDDSLSEELERELTTQEDQHDTLRDILEHIQTLKETLEGLGLELSGELEIEGDVATMDDVEGRLRADARRNRGSRA